MADLSGWIPKHVMADYLNWYIGHYFNRDLSKYNDHEKVIYLEHMMGDMRGQLEAIVSNVLEDEDAKAYAKETADDFDKYKELRIV